MLKGGVFPPSSRILQTSRIATSASPPFFFSEYLYHVRRMWSPEERELINTCLFTGWLMSIHLIAQMDFASWLQRTSVNQIFLLPSHTVLYKTIAKQKWEKHNWQKKGQRERAAVIFKGLNTETNKVCFQIFNHEFSLNALLWIQEKEGTARREVSLWSASLE